MNIFEKVLYFLQGTMETPKAFGGFHIICITIIGISLLVLCLNIKSHNEKRLNWIFIIYGVGALILEILKQLIWSFNFDSTTKLVSWDYQWYAFPFQLCTTPVFVSLICVFLKKGTFKVSLFSYLAYFTILGSFVTMILPDSCFTEDILVNIHTMYLHLGSFVLSIYLIVSKEVKPISNNFIGGFIVFLIFVFIAYMLNIIIYNIGILKGETFNMFYISPYFISVLPVFNVIQQNVPHLLFLIIYLVTLTTGAGAIYWLSKIKLCKKVK